MAPVVQAAAISWMGVAQQLSLASASTDFTPHGTQPGLQSPLLTAGDCGGCHAGSVSQGTLAFRPFSTWSGSMMANATRDPLFFAALDIANHDVAGSGDFCLRCHTSRGWYGGHVVKSGVPGAANDPTQGAAGCLLYGVYDEPDDLGSDFSGVDCHYCHRLMPQGPSGQPAMIGNGNAWVDDAPCTNPDSQQNGGPCRRGPYNYASISVSPPHEWAFSPYHTQSAVCATCHDVTSPDTKAYVADGIFADGFERAQALRTLKLDDGSDTGLAFPLERTFSEWQQSQYAQAPQTTCQACHMPSSEAPNASACALSGYPNRSGDLPVHAFVGGNTWVPSIIKGEYDDTSAVPGAYGGLGRADSFDQSIAWARDLLGNAATVDASIQGYTPPTVSVPGTMEVGVRVTNLSGHKLPTGYGEGRRMWIDLQVHDANGVLVFESGAYDAAAGVLALDAQARVYEVRQGIYDATAGRCAIVDSGGGAMFHFVTNDCIAKDNRIPPLGFRPATAADPHGYELRPVGATYAETTPGSGVLVNFDNAAYAVTLPAGSVGPFTANARLYYQTASRDYITFLRDQAVTNAFPDENAMCGPGDANRPRPFVVGPQDRTRGEYVYQLWDNAPTDSAQPGYGKSPPELMQVGTVTTP